MAEESPAPEQSEMASKQEPGDEEEAAQEADSGIREQGKEEPEESSKSEPGECISEDSSEQSSPRGVIEVAVSGGGSSESSYESISSSEVSSQDQSLAIVSTETTSNLHNLHWKHIISGLMLRRKKSMMRASTFPATVKNSLGLRRYLERICSRKEHAESRIAVVPDIAKWHPSWRNFDYQELVTATNDFSADNLVGKGGHAEVFKGHLVDGQLVAVKRLTKGSKDEDRIGVFLLELGIVAHVNHPNTAQLLGFGIDEGLHLVLQFSPHGSLSSQLHGAKDILGWNLRYKIALGIAEGLAYLHQGCHRRIIHRDIKASNILLTEEFEPQISDFGLSKWLPDNLPHLTVYPIEGTFGYLAPEYFMHGIVNEKTDVFAFGVLLLELTTGRKAIDSARQSLVIWAKPLLDRNDVKELVDSSLSDVYEPEEMARTLAVASMCIHHVSALRPSMNLVLRFLKGGEGLDDLMLRNNKAVRQPIVDACESDNYTSSTYLTDLSRHKQIALEQ